MILSVVVPCFNEELVLPETSKRLGEVLNELINNNKISLGSHILFVDDGSSDGTWEIIENLADDNPIYRGIKLSRNKGHQLALLAGLHSAEGDIVISVDADLQDDLNAIGEMIDEYHLGSDVVYGVRKSRQKDTFFKRFSAEVYYRLLRFMGVDVIFNHADYRLLSRRVIWSLKEYDEVNIFLRGIIPQIGYPFSVVYYDRNERFAGESKYPLRKMLAFAWEGITSFSIVPLRLITVCGVIIFSISLLISFWALWIRIFTDQAIPGWTSTVIPIYFLGGVQMLGIGVIGEYLSKMFLETKHRPRYFIEKIIK
jgi:glycosyltransferase involved in cell wall biosynthesis